MKFLLDTNAVIAIMSGHPTFTARVRIHDPADFAIPVIAMHELFFGASKSRRVAENLQRVEALQFRVLEFDREDARHAGTIRAGLAAAGTPIGPYDVLIAGQAVARGLILVTRNTREFSRVAGLRFEDWEC